MVRIQVACSDNIFFDISNQNLSIEVPPTPTFLIAPITSEIDVCAPDDAVFDLEILGFSGFSEPVSLSASGSPPGTTTSLLNNPVTPTAAIQMTIGNTTSGSTGSYTISLEGTGGGISQSTELQLNLYAGMPENVGLISPANNAQYQSLTPEFSWVEMTNAETYDIEIATDAGFSSIVAAANGLTTNSFVPSTIFDENTTYYWRVRAVNPCAVGDFSSAYQFSTSPIICTTYSSTDVPISIPSNSATTVSSSFTINDDYQITDLNVLNVTGTHTWINDLIISLTSPNNTTVTLLPQICYYQNNFDLSFDDEAANNNYPCPPTGGGTYQPDGNLSDFYGESSQGQWTMTIEDVYPEDGGSFTKLGKSKSVPWSLLLQLPHWI